MYRLIWVPTEPSLSSVKLGGQTAAEPCAELWWQFIACPDPGRFRFGGVMVLLAIANELTTIILNPDRAKFKTASQRNAVFPSDLDKTLDQGAAWSSIHVQARFDIQQVRENQSRRSGFYIDGRTYASTTSIEQRLMGEIYRLCQLTAINLFIAL